MSSILVFVKVHAAVIPENARSVCKSEYVWEGLSKSKIINY